MKSITKLARNMTTPTKATYPADAAIMKFLWVFSSFLSTNDARIKTSPPSRIRNIPRYPNCLKKKKFRKQTKRIVERILLAKVICEISLIPLLGLNSITKLSSYLAKQRQSASILIRVKQCRL